jgi:hypothetical protein
MRLAWELPASSRQALPHTARALFANRVYVEEARETEMTMRCNPFTIIELLPALHIAKYKGQQIVCINQIKQQYLFQYLYADDNDSEYADRSGNNSPDYHRRNGNPLSPVSKMRGDYVTDTSIMVCPITAGVPSQPFDEYKRSDWNCNCGYGGWDTEAAHVYQAYMWMANFRGATSYLNGEPEFPTKTGDSKEDQSFIAHRITFYGGGSAHSIGHKGVGLFGAGAAPNGHPITDSPVGYGDGHAKTLPRVEMKDRMTTSAGLYVW